MRRHWVLLRLVVAVILFSLCTDFGAGQAKRAECAKLTEESYKAKEEKEVLTGSSITGELNGTDSSENLGSIEESASIQTDSSQDIDTTEDTEKVIVVTQMISTPSSLVTAIGNSFSKKRVSFNLAKRKGKKIVLQWKKLTGAVGYQIQYAVIKKGIKKTGKKRVLKILKRGKSYFGKDCTLNVSGITQKQILYVRVRAYARGRTAQGKMKRVYAKWSAVKSVV